MCSYKDPIWARDTPLTRKSILGGECRWLKSKSWLSDFDLDMGLPICVCATHGSLFALSRVLEAFCDRNSHNSAAWGGHRGPLSMGTARTVLWRTGCFHYQATTNINQERAPRGQSNEESRHRWPVSTRGSEWFIYILEIVHRILHLTNPFPTNSATFLILCPPAIFREELNLQKSILLFYNFLSVCW